MKRVLFLVPYPQGEAASQRFRFEQYLPALQETGWDVHLSPFLDLRAWKVLYQPGHLDRKAFAILRGYLRRLGDLLKLGRYDAVFIHREASPFGPLVAESAPYRAGHAAGDPYRGYHFKILTRQGKAAPGGAYNYLINGRMLAGFAMVAYPAVWDQTGVMTFMVNQNGKIYQKDLGKNSTAIGAQMTSFDPGPGWKHVAP